MASSTIKKITPSNIGAHPENTRLMVTNQTDYTGSPQNGISAPMVQAKDTNDFIRHQVYGVYNSNGSFYTFLNVRKPGATANDSAISNQIGVGFDANGNASYNIGDTIAFRNTLGASSGVWPIALGGTGGTTPSAARTALEITPANIGAHPANTTLRVTIDSDYDDGVAANGAVAQLLDNNGFIRHQMYGAHTSSGSMYTYLAVRKPDGTSAISNHIAVGIDSSGNPLYSIPAPAAFRSALELGNVNNSLVLTATTGAALYTQLSALPASPTNGAGVTCYMSNPSLLLLTGKTGLSGALYGIITRLSSARFHVFGLYANTYLMYWSFDITSAGAITPATVYKLQGTAM